MKMELRCLAPMPRFAVAYEHHTLSVEAELDRQRGDSFSFLFWRDVAFG